MGGHCIVSYWGKKAAKWIFWHLRTSKVPIKNHITVGTKKWRCRREWGQESQRGCKERSTLKISPSFLLQQRFILCEINVQEFEASKRCLEVHQFFLYWFQRKTRSKVCGSSESCAKSNGGCQKIMWWMTLSLLRRCILPTQAGNHTNYTVLLYFHVCHVLDVLFRRCFEALAVSRDDIIGQVRVLLWLPPYNTESVQREGMGEYDWLQKATWSIRLTCSQMWWTWSLWAHVLLCPTG